MLTHTLGFSRMGAQRELKKALEAHWRGDADASALENTAREIRLRHWRLQRDAGIDLVPVNDFSLYDHMLDMSALLGAVPPRFDPHDDRMDLDTYFLMARGGQCNGRGVAAMEMSKWFDTNYHYIVPEFAPGQRFGLRSDRLFSALAEARQEKMPAKAVLPGPMTYLFCGKAVTPGFDRFDLLPDVVRAYEAILRRAQSLCAWIQLDEPVLAMDLPPALRGDRFREVYGTLAKAAGSARLMVATYFGSIAHNAEAVADLPVSALHLDLVRAPEQLDALCDALSPTTTLSLGVVDGRNIWRVEADRAAAIVTRAAARWGRGRLMIAPSCSLLHVPVDLDTETALPPAITRWMAFGRQKCVEVRKLADMALGHADPTWMQDNRDAWAARRRDPALHRNDVRERLARVRSEMFERSEPFASRRDIQRQRLGLPLLPTTTIGSFPQTPDIRAARRLAKQGELDADAYVTAMQDHIRDAVARQEALDLDVLVHGEPERNDMVEYFGEQLGGFCFTRNGWVQSYGSRCVKPPVIFGDVAREQPMTVAWSVFAQSLTQKPVKGMLTGPVTILSWSFVRDDQPRRDTCAQIALAIRDEVLELEQAGLRMIQVDEPALREGAPLRRQDWDDYFRWAVDSYRLAANAAAPETQIHTHMCYSEFNDMMAWIAAMDADVISIEASRSRMELLEAFKTFRYPNEVGPGVYDIHSPRVPEVDEIAELLRKAAAVIPVDRLWVNPDCGLKTRGWEETTASLRNMVAAAKLIRAEQAD